MPLLFALFAFFQSSAKPTPQMKLKVFWLLAAVLLTVAIVCHNTTLYYYWGALVLTVTYLNSVPQYLQQPYKRYNAVFLSYLSFVVWERTRHYGFYVPVEYWINNLEHIFFGLMICFITSLVLSLPPFNVKHFSIRLLLSVLIFNCIGFINEWFQNTLQHRPILTLIPDSQKDIKMNLLGTTAFILLAIFIQQKKKATLRGALGKNG